MDNQIKFSPKKKDEPFSVSEEEFRALEIENIQLKNTNRKLISKLDKQKNLIKNLTFELRSIKNNQQNKSFDELQTDYKQLKTKYDDLKEDLKKSKAELARLNKKLNDKSRENATENTEKTTGNIGQNSIDTNEKKETSEASTNSRWDKLKSRLPDDFKSLRDSKKIDEKD